MAIANAKLAYQLSKKIYSDERWQRLAQQGAQTQRLLWASTGTKNKAYSDVLYVDELIGADTVNTIPPATMDAFRDHGRLRPSLEEDVAGAKAVMDALPPLGISIDAVTAKLVDDGVRLFADAADHLYAAVQNKRRSVLGGKLNAMSYKLPEELDKDVQAALEDWRKDGKVRRLWAADASLWTETDEAHWLGWLEIVDKQLKGIAHLQDFADDVRRTGFRDVLLLGMGGSSLGPEVLSETFGSRSGFPNLHVLDSTDPAQIRHFEARYRPGANIVPGIEQVRQHTRAEYLQAVLLRAGKAGRRRERGAKSLRRDHRPGLVARKDGADRGVPQRLPRAAEYWRADIRCYPISGWCRPRQSVSTFRPFWRARPRWCGHVPRARRRSRTRGLSLVRSSGLASAAGATR